MKGDETLDIQTDQYPGPCVEIIVDTHEMDVNKAGSIGSPLVDILAGLFVARLSTDIINRKLWSGLKGTRLGGSEFLVSGESFNSSRGVPLEKLKERVAKISGFDPTILSSSRPTIALSLRWFLKGLLETNHNDRFLSLWLSAIALYASWCESQKQSYLSWCSNQTETRDTERNKIRYYIQNRLNLTGPDEEAFFQALSDSYDLRIALIHKANIGIVESRHISRLARATGSMLWVEMGFPLGGSPAVLVKE